MYFKSLVDSLTKIVGTPAEDKAVAMDIVDNRGRHHQPKAIPEGGQYEEEGKYAATATAKEEWFHKTFAENKKPQMKKMRDFCAEILSRVDSSKLGNDTAVSDYKKQVHKYADMTKASVLDGMKKAWNDMKTHADTYNDIKGMGKDEFAGWLKSHPEYDSPQMQNLMTNKAYGKTYKIKNAAGEYEDQDHAAWEEAKMMVARKAVASMVDYMAHSEALHNTPDALIDSFLKGKGKGEKHKLGYEDYEKTHGIKHGEGENANTATMSEINAVESEMQKAIDDSQTQTEKTAYFHALSHFLGKEGGLRNPNVTKDDVLTKAAKRIIEKENKLKEAAASGDKDAYNTAAADFDATQKAAQILGKALGVTNGKLGEILFKNKHPDVEGENPKEVGTEVPTEQITQKPDEPKKVEEKKTLTEAGKKYKAALGDFLNSDNGKKLETLASTIIEPDQLEAHKKYVGNNSIAQNKTLMDNFQKEAKEAMTAGDKDKAKKAWARYHMTAKAIFDQLSAFGEE